MALIKELPLASRFYAEKRGGPEYRGWDETAYALPAVVNAVRALQYTLLLVNTDKDKRRRIPPPELYPTPEVRALKKKPKPGSFRAIVTSAFAAMRRKRKAEADG